MLILAFLGSSFFSLADSDPAAERAALEKELKEVASGNLSKRIKLRRNDALKPLVDDINTLLDRITDK